MLRCTCLSSFVRDTVYWTINDVIACVHLNPGAHVICLGFISFKTRVWQPGRRDSAGWFQASPRHAVTHVWLAKNKWTQTWVCLVACMDHFDEQTYTWGCVCCARMDVDVVIHVWFWWSYHHIYQIWKHNRLSLRLHHHCSLLLCSSTQHLTRPSLQIIIGFCIVQIQNKWQQKFASD